MEWKFPNFLLTKAVGQYLTIFTFQKKLIIIPKCNWVQSAFNWPNGHTFAPTARPFFISP
ncbi:hypothetical protein TorRG33x02_309520 [Trema orientale]|uniref:Uncharacterized protein n=1 Tax=Trema orientale TaxID=63057 RepID=A0A2P5BTJ3_TREOI|nr:hypothetical protein TorRG33x02_309520 [Trema orientale]